MRRVPFHAEPIENAFLPLNAVVPLRNGPTVAEAVPVVSIGQEVREGQLLAKATVPGAANAHSPIPGIVRRIEAATAIGGYDTGTIRVSLEGSFSVLGKRPERYLWKSLNKADIGHVAQEKGLVRVTTGEPLYAALAKRASTPGYALVVNALEMDPYLRVEETLLAQRPLDVVDGCAIAARVAEPGSILFAIDETCAPAVVARLREALASAELEISIRFFKRRIPQDMPRQLADALGRDEASIFVIEPSTLVCLHDAVVSNKPHVEQYVYVGGGAVKRPAVLKARIGAPIGDLLEECGGFIGKPQTIVVGGPFTGRAAMDLDVAVTKTTRAVLALTAEEVKPAPERPCVRCGDCLEVCPEGLDPSMLLKLLRSGRSREAVAAGLARCSSCGACASACRSRIPLVAAFDEAKSTGVDSSAGGRR